MELLKNDKEKLKKVIIKIMTVSRSVDDVFDFFNNPKNMELGGALKLLISYMMIKTMILSGGYSIIVLLEDQRSNILQLENMEFMTMYL